MKYRSKQYPKVIVEAIQFFDDPDSIAELVAFGLSPVRVSYEQPENPMIKLEHEGGVYYVAVGDYVVRTEHAALSSIPAGFFEHHFEEAKNG